MNQVPDTGRVTIIDYLYYYNGGGIAAGDVDGNGLPDLYFTSNLGPDRLYLNRGDFRFEDVTEQAGIVPTGGWASGVTMADVEGDGDLDIYVSGVRLDVSPGRNVLWLNDGGGRFRDATEELGLAFEGYATQAAFFDYDLDGDLDVYLLNHSVHTERGVSSSPQREGQHPRAGDRLLRNDGGRFTDASAEAGILGGVEGYGLGVAVSDLDGNGCPDIFVANDFQENDFLYINRCDGTFAESIGRQMGHTSRFSMGVDAADMDNDGRTDVVVLDMLPDREDVLKTSANAEGFDLYELRVRAGYHPQFARNTLQLNRGADRFSDIGYLAGVHATDWSWAPLFADLDNDGWKDLFVTTGIHRRPNDLDFINYLANDAVQAGLAAGDRTVTLEVLNEMPSLPIPDAAFRNRGDLTFESVADAWGLGAPGFSNGAVYVDLDGSGALDLVVNHLNAPAGIYRNRGRERNENHWLALTLEGGGANTAGIGARVTVWHGERTQVAEQMPTRGFQSAVAPGLHFGLGSDQEVDSLRVDWPDGRRQTLRGVRADRSVTLRQADAGPPQPGPPSPTPLFADAGDGSGLEVVHAENRFFDYNRERLMPRKVSTEGPALAVGDVDGDGRDDVFVGGAKHQSGSLFLQAPDGSFRAREVPAFHADSLLEDVDAAFLDVDGDDRLDLFVVTAGNEFWGEADQLRDRIYMGDGTGGFTRDRARVPDVFENGSRAAVGDFDDDGDPDLFVGGRVVARAYGSPPRSVLLRNDAGRFVDVTAELAPELERVGMVTDAVWTDASGDGALDLVVVGEWMGVRVFEAAGGRFVDRSAERGLSDTEGWWNAVAATDLDGDGLDDLILGNLGRNTYLRATPEEPARLWIHDFDSNGTTEQILTFFKQGMEVPLQGREELLAQMPMLRSRFPSFRSFGASGLEDVFTAEELEGATVLTARTRDHAVARNGGADGFRLEPLPVEAQLAPIYAILPGDVDGDGATDLIVAGNFDGVPPVLGRYDASYGLLLAGTGDGGFRPVPMERSGIRIDGEARHLARVTGGNGAPRVVVARNGAPPQLLRPTRLGPPVS